MLRLTIFPHVQNWLPIPDTPAPAPSQPHNRLASALQQNLPVACRPHRQRAPEPDIQIEDVAEKGTAELRLRMLARK